MLTAAELRTIWLALESLPASPPAAIYQLILLTGQRPSEVATMRWADLDLDNAVWTQATNKSDRRHVVPLSDAAVAILRAQRPTVTELFPNPLVFHSSTGRELGLRSANWDRFNKHLMTATGTSDGPA